MGTSRAWPEWWTWELELSPHVEKRMEDRGFNEVELREMLQSAKGYREDVVEVRWAIDTKLRGRPWVVILEPDSEARVIVAVTAYASEKL